MLNEELLERGLPDVLQFKNGKPVLSPDDWYKRKKEIEKLLTNEIYGNEPSASYLVEGKEVRYHENAFCGKAIFKEIEIRIIGENFYYAYPCYMALPKNNSNPPSFLYLSFASMFYGAEFECMPVEEIIDQGYGLISFYYQEVVPDIFDYFNNGICSSFARNPHNGWGKLAMWAWGASRVMDYLQTADDIDKKEVAVMGMSRLGKTALWAGAMDERFSAVISVDSGAGGAALYRGKTGEGIEELVKPERFPYWFCGNFKKYAGKHEMLPVDSHFLLSMIAPRPLYICSAKDDDWSDPKSEFLGAYATSKTYDLLGMSGLVTEDEYPLPGSCLHDGTIGYHLRYGTHGINRDDWNQIIRFRNTFRTT